MVQFVDISMYIKRLLMFVVFFVVLLCALYGEAAWARGRGGVQPHSIMGDRTPSFHILKIGNISTKGAVLNN